MTIQHTNALFIMICVMIGVVAPASDVTLVNNGKATCTILADGGISPSEKTAVAELQKYLKAISGAEVPHIDPAQYGQGGVQIAGMTLVVGSKTVKRLYPETDLASLGTDGFILKSTGNALLIAGGETRGTLYAVFALLEKLGVRWWAVGATQIPKAATLSIPTLDERQIPALEYRDMLYGNSYISEEDHFGTFYVHNRVNGFNFATNPISLGGKVMFEGNLVHSYDVLMQPVGTLDGSFAKHPELWALVRGKRQETQPCLSNPQVFEIMKANVLKQLKDHPDNAFVVVGQLDNNDYCQCADCAALAAAEESHSGPVIAFANKIGEVVEREFPGKWVMAPAYTWSRKPPKHIRPRSNVGVTLCTIECDFARPLAEGSTPANKAFADDIINWSKIAPKLYIWDYTTNFNHYLMPHPNLDALVANVKFLADHRVQGLLNQGSHTTQGAEFAQLRMWVLAKAMWDPQHADGKALITEFLNGYYGPAAPHIQRYIDIMHTTGRADPSIASTCYALLNSAWLAPDNIAAAEAALVEAERTVANDPALLKRVRQVHMSIWYMLLKRGPQSATWKATQAKNATLHIGGVAKDFVQATAESRVGSIAEGEIVKPFVDWALDYAERASRAIPLPPELVGVDPTTYRLIQACQMDSRGRWWVRQDGASDGWVSEVPTIGWTVSHCFSLRDDVESGKTYKLFVRVKASATTWSGDAFACGVYGKAKSFQFKVAATKLVDGAFHAIEVGEITAGPDMGSFWIALTDGAAPKVLLDCLWLQAVQK
ncbi:MAG: DUF4838 domain-containing protein [Planctomycetota bacterium]